MIQARLMAGMFIVLAILTSYFATYRYGRHAEAIAQQNTINALIVKAQAANDALKLKLEEQKTNAEAAINVLLNVKPPRVRLPAYQSQAPATVASVSAVESAGVLPGGAEEILGEDRLRTQEIIGRAERELAGCRIAKEWVKLSF